VLSTKYDGSQHNDYAARLIEDQLPASPPGGCVRLFVPEGTPLSSYRGAGRIGVPFTALFWPGSDRWFNVYHNHRATDRHSIETYVNVSLPAQFDGETLRWVDMDLDVVVLTGERVELWDEDEFAEHRQRFGYPEDVATRAQEAAYEVMRLASMGEAPLDRVTHIWRA
jgi:hypothetical protein